MHRWLTATIAMALLTGGCGGGGDTAAGDGAAGETERAVAERASDGNTAETAAAAGEEVVYVDVRSPEEFAAGHVVGAINIPHTEMAARHDELEPHADKEIVLYCRTGRRSGMAQDVLEREGFTNLTNAGGLRDLEARGVPTTR